jgi:hypothetical protein
MDIGNKNKNYSTEYSHVVPHHSTDSAISCLTAQIGRDAVLLTVYGRNSKGFFSKCLNSSFFGLQISHGGLVAPPANFLKLSSQIKKKKLKLSSQF